MSLRRVLTEASKPSNQPSIGGQQASAFNAIDLVPERQYRQLCPRCSTGFAVVSSQPRDDRRRRRLDLGDRPVSFPIYAIGDVHGSLDLLLQAERKILADLAGSSSPLWSFSLATMSIADAIPAVFSSICCNRRRRRCVALLCAAITSSYSAIFLKIRKTTCTGWISGAARRFCPTASI